MVRFGIVGAGGIAKKFINDIQLVENAELTAVSARTPEKASTYKKRYHAKFAFSSYEEMAKSDVIDAAYIATPHNFHFEQAILFMKNKKHVIIEKPIAVNTAQYEEMMKVAKENNVVMMEAMWTYFLPATLWLNRVVNNNILGKLLKAHIVFGFPLNIGKTKENRLLNPDLAGGGLLDLGVYPINYYLLLKHGEIKSFNAKADFTKTGVDSAGVIGIIDDDQTEFILKYSLNKILGDKATLKFENGEIIMKNFHGCQEVILNGHSISIPFEGEGFTHEIRSFVQSIENNESENSVLPMEHSRQSMLLLDKVREQIQLKYPFE
jgi:predicted dehydrogenase